MQDGKQEGSLPESQEERISRLEFIVSNLVSVIGLFASEKKHNYKRLTDSCAELFDLMPTDELTPKEVSNGSNTG